jgi:tripartite-type tricarboxylate transporter receptor subunit TctC
VSHNRAPAAEPVPPSERRDDGVAADGKMAGNEEERVMTHVRRTAALVVVALAGSVASLHAQDGYPARAIRVVVPFAPGGSVDLLARLVAPRLSEGLGQQVVVDNRAGASGNIGTEIVARAAPDGYTLLVNTLPFVVNTHLFPKLPYDVQADFAPVALLSSSPSLVAVHPSLPVRGVRELVDLARAKPGVLNYGTAGPGSNPNIAGELFNLLGKVNIVAVHYKGGGPALVATLGGELAVSFSNISDTYPYVAAKRLRPLAVTSLQRSRAMPDVPTVAEAGVPGYEFVTWHGLLAPRATPRPVVTLLNDRVRRAMTAPDQVRRFEERGLDVVASTPEEFGSHLAAELKKWAAVVKERGMRAE